MHSGDREEALGNFDPGEVDSEFLPYLDRINRFLNVISVQCCSGHLAFQPIPGGTANRAGRWGYLMLFMDFDLAEWLNEKISSCDWLLIELSQMWIDGAYEPAVTQNEAYELAFAWEAHAWPQPAEDICKFIEEYHGCADGPEDLFVQGA